jgi:hypothetical protein
MRKCTVLLLITCLVVSSLFVLTVVPATVQAVSKPSVPQFSVKFVDNSYDVPTTTTTTIDPYTGKESTYTSYGYHVVDRTVEVSIKNQPFTPYTDENSQKHQLYYNIQYKGRFETDWYPPMFAPGYIVQSDSEYTDISGVLWSINYFEIGAQLDFKIEAVIGYTELYYADKWFPVGSTFIVEETSGWSAIQTITLAGETTSSSSPPSQIATFPPAATSDGNGQQQYYKPTQPPNSIFTSPFFMLGIGALFGGIVVVAVVMVILRRRPKTSTYINDSAPTSTRTEL